MVVDAGSFSRRDLCMIALVSPLLRYEAQRVLFRDPGQQWIALDDADEFITANSFLLAIISSPDCLAPMVRRYHVTLSWHNFYSAKTSAGVGDRRNVQSPNFHCLSKSLPLMTNLTMLHIYTDKGRWFDRVPPPITPIFKQCSFQLEVFRCSYIDAGHKDRKLLQDFLRSQTSMYELWVLEINTTVDRTSTKEDFDVLQDVCSSIVCMGGTPGFIIGVLLTGQQLRHICWEGFWTATNYHSIQTEHFPSVELMENFSQGPNLSLISTVFPNLILYKTECRSEVFEAADVLPNLLRLRVFLIVFEPRSGHSFKRFMQNAESYIRRIFSSSLSLQYIEVHNHEGGKKYVIDRTTRVITVYVIPAGIPLHTGEMHEELLHRVPVRIGPNDTFLKTFPSLLR